jgi:molybdate transport system substrate-binding protein
MRAFGRTVTIAAVLMSLAGMARAAEVRVLSVGAVQNAVKSIAAEFTKETGHRVVLTFASPAAVTQKVAAGEPFDAVIASEPAMDQFDREGTVNPESRQRLANVGIGLAARAGAPVPDVSTPDGFKAALTAAKSIVYGDPAVPNASGETVEKVLAKAGILDAVKPKVQIVPDRLASQDMIAKGEAELGLYNLSEIPDGKGLKLVGPVPRPLQVTTTFEGALLSDGSAPEATTAFIRFLAEPDARAKWIAAKLEPLLDH